MLDGTEPCLDSGVLFDWFLYLLCAIWVIFIETTAQKFYFNHVTLTTLTAFFFPLPLRFNWTPQLMIWVNNVKAMVQLKIPFNPQNAVTFMLAFLICCNLSACHASFNNNTLIIVIN